MWPPAGATVQHEVTASIDTVAIDADDGGTTVERRSGENVRIEATKYAIGRTDPSDITVTRDLTDGHLAVGVDRTDGLSVGTAGGGLESPTVGVPAGVRVTELDVDDGSVSFEPL